MIKISEWYGRLGNNIIQLINGIHIAKKHNLKFEYPNHPIITNKVFDYTNENTDNTINLYNHFFFNDNDYLKEYPVNDKIKEILQYIKPLINYNKQNIELTDDDLVIHIRSGDIFALLKYETNGLYSQPPLSFYEKILKETSYKNYYLVAENYCNPIINILLKKYPKIIPIINNKPHEMYKINDELINDIYYILEAKNLVLSNSGMPYILILFNNNIKNIYVPESNMIKHTKVPLYNEMDILYFNNTFKEYNYYKFPSYYIDNIDKNILLLYPEEFIEKYTI